MEKILEKVGVGEVFKVAGIEWIKFYDENGHTVAVAKDSLYDTTFGNNNNFAESKPLQWLKENVLPKIEKEVGAENVVDHEVDLLSMDGSDKWGKVNTKISIPTFDFYRKHVKVFDRYKLDKWWWLATPDTTTDHYNHDYWVSCVSPRGFVNYHFSDYYINIGVRPFLTFISSISVSCEE